MIDASDCEAGTWGGAARWDGVGFCRGVIMGDGADRGWLIILISFPTASNSLSVVRS